MKLKKERHKKKFKYKKNKTGRHKMPFSSKYSCNIKPVSHPMVLVIFTIYLCKIAIRNCNLKSLMIFTHCGENIVITVFSLEIHPVMANMNELEFSHFKSCEFQYWQIITFYIAYLGTICKVAFLNRKKNHKILELFTYLHTTYNHSFATRSTSKLAPIAIYSDIFSSHIHFPPQIK